MSAIKANSGHQPDRRWHVRYRVHGSLVLDAGGSKYKALPVNLGLGGILFKADRLPPVNTTGMLQLNIDGFGETIVASVRIIRAQETSAAAIFVRPEETLVRCFGWLASKGLQEKEQ